MSASLVLTVLAADRPGLVKLLSDIAAAHGANWLESRMARLAGQFAGIVRIECAPESSEPLIAALGALVEQGIHVQTHIEPAPPAAPAEPLTTLSIDVVGNDRPGIVRELAAAIASAGANVEEFTTGLESAAMSGHPLFRARGTVTLPARSDSANLVLAIENLSGDLSVEII